MKVWHVVVLFSLWQLAMNRSHRRPHFLLWFLLRALTMAPLVAVVYAGRSPVEIGNRKMNGRSFFLLFSIRTTIMMLCQKPISPFFRAAQMELWLTLRRHETRVKSIVDRALERNLTKIDKNNTKSGENINKVSRNFSFNDHSSSVASLSSLHTVSFYVFVLFEWKKASRKNI